MWGGGGGVGGWGGGRRVRGLGGGRGGKGSGDGGDDEVAEEAVGFLGGTLLFVKTATPLGSLLRVSQLAVRFGNRVAEHGMSRLLAIGNLLRVFVLGVVADDRLTKTIGEIDITVVVQSATHSANRCFKICFCHSSYDLFLCLLNRIVFVSFSSRFRD